MPEIELVENKGCKQEVNYTLECGHSLASSPGHTHFSMLHASPFSACKIEKWVWPWDEASHSIKALYYISIFISRGCGFVSDQSFFAFVYTIKATVDYRPPTSHLCGLGIRIPVHLHVYMQSGGVSPFIDCGSQFTQKLPSAYLRRLPASGSLSRMQVLACDQTIPLS